MRRSSLRNDESFRGDLAFQNASLSLISLPRRCPDPLLSREQRDVVKVGFVRRGGRCPGELFAVAATRAARQGRSEQSPAVPDRSLSAPDVPVTARYTTVSLQPRDRRVFASTSMSYS